MFKNSVVMVFGLRNVLLVNIVVVFLLIRLVVKFSREIVNIFFSRSSCGVARFNNCFGDVKVGVGVEFLWIGNNIGLLILSGFGSEFVNGN